MKRNKYLIELLIAFYKFTHTVERIVDNSINNALSFLKKKKEEYIKIIHEYQAMITIFWIEHQINDLLKISFVLFLILWVIFQSYYYGGMSHISYEKYLQIKKLLFTLEQKNEQYVNVIQTQNDEIENMTYMLKKCQHRLHANIFSASMLLLIGSTLGLVVGGFLTLITMSK